MTSSLGIRIEQHQEKRTAWIKAVENETSSLSRKAMPNKTPSLLTSFGSQVCFNKHEIFKKHIKYHRIIPLEKQIDFFF